VHKTAFRGAKMQNSVASGELAFRLYCTMDSAVSLLFAVHVNAIVVVL